MAKVPKPSACRFSREQPPAARLAGVRSGLYSLPLRARELSVVLPLQAIMRRLKPASRGNRRLLCFLLVPDASLPPRFAANDPARCRSCETKARLKVVRNGAGLLANPRIGARFETYNETKVGGGICRGVFGTFCGQKVHNLPRAETAVSSFFAAQKDKKLCGPRPRLTADQKAAKKTQVAGLRTPPECAAPLENRFSGG